MLPTLGALYGNPSSGYRVGSEARLAVERARRHVAALVGGGPEDIVFTSGGTEANNLALIGVRPRPARASSRRHGRSSTRPCSSPPVAPRRGGGGDPGARPDGAVDPAEVSPVQPHTVLVSVMHANNEVGTFQPVAEVAAGVAPPGRRCTPTPPRAPARLRSTSARSASTCSASPATSCMRRRGSAPCTSGRGRPCSRTLRRGTGGRIQSGHRKRTAHRRPRRGLRARGRGTRRERPPRACATRPFRGGADRPHR